MTILRASDLQGTARETLLSSLRHQVEMGTQSNIVRDILHNNNMGVALTTMQGTLGGTPL